MAIPPLAKHLLKTYYKDWLCAVALIAVSFTIELIRPFQRFYFIDDQSISYPHQTKETIPNWALFLIGFVLPVVLLIVMRFVFRRQIGVQIHHSLLGLVLGMAGTLLLTQILKLAVGRLRPDFISRCAPLTREDNAPCTGKVDFVDEGRKSFPSGHASTAFAGMVFLSICLIGAFKQLYRPKNALMEVHMRLLPVYVHILATIPVVVAILIAVSRVCDYMHHWQDVTVGGIIGSVFAVLAYHQYYESIIGEKAGDPICSFEEETHNIPLHQANWRDNNSSNASADAAFIPKATQ